jgi:MORN repeat
LLSRYEYANGSSYEGGWKKDKKHGRGVYEAAGERFEGEYVLGEKQGTGIFLFAGGQRYEGGWNRSEKSGFGRLEFPDGAVFEGNWMNVGASLIDRIRLMAMENSPTQMVMSMTEIGSTDSNMVTGSTFTLEVAIHIQETGKTMSKME